MSPEEQAVLAAARRWARLAEREGVRHEAQQEAEATLREAVRSWLGEAATATDEDYAEQATERLIESTSAASTTDRTEAVEQLTQSPKRGTRGGAGESR
jgi:hypothetical protein